MARMADSSLARLSGCDCCWLLVQDASVIRVDIKNIAEAKERK
jgi:hypothetical protein